MYGKLMYGDTDYHHDDDDDSFDFNQYEHGAGDDAAGGATDVLGLAVAGGVCALLAALALAAWLGWCRRRRARARARAADGEAAPAPAPAPSPRPHRTAPYPAQIVKMYPVSRHGRAAAMAAPPPAPPAAEPLPPSAPPAPATAPGPNHELPPSYEQATGVKY